MIKSTSLTQAMMDMRPPTPGMQQNGQSDLYDALGAEMQRQQKVKEVRMKYGLSPKPMKAPVPQWMGDNQT